MSGELFDQYIHDMKLVQHFAMLNRQAMMDEIIKGMKLHVAVSYTHLDGACPVDLNEYGGMGYGKSVDHRLRRRGQRGYS